MARSGLGMNQSKHQGVKDTVNEIKRTELSFDNMENFHNKFENTKDIIIVQFEQTIEDFNDNLDELENIKKNERFDELLNEDVVPKSVYEKQREIIKDQNRALMWIVVLKELGLSVINKYHNFATQLESLNIEQKVITKVKEYVEEVLERESQREEIRIERTNQNIKNISEDMINSYQKLLNNVRKSMQDMVSEQTKQIEMIYDITENIADASKKGQPQSIVDEIEEVEEEVKEMKESEPKKSEKKVESKTRKLMEGFEEWLEELEIKADNTDNAELLDLYLNDSEGGKKIKEPDDVTEDEKEKIIQNALE